MLDRGLLNIKTDLWLLPVGSRTEREPRRFLQGKAALEPRFSPDGQQVAFLSAVEGVPELWTANIDGTGLARLTTTPGIGPRWSPDGKQIAFISGSNRSSDVFLVNADGTDTRQFTKSDGIERSPTWSADSQHVYFGSNRTGQFEIWKKPVAGGEAVQITEDGGAEAFEPPEWPGLLFVKQRPEMGIYAKRSTGTGIINRGGLEGAWTVNRDGIYFLGRANEPRPAIYFTRGQRWRPTVVAEIPGRLPRRRPGFDVSPDGEWVVVALEAVP
jgi:tricorn protease-like protein